MFVVEKLDEGICTIAVCALRVCGGGTGGYDDWYEGMSVHRRYKKIKDAHTVVCYVAEIEASFWIAKARASNNLTK